MSLSITEIINFNLLNSVVKSTLMTHIGILSHAFHTLSPGMKSDPFLKGPSVEPYLTFTLYEYRYSRVQNVTYTDRVHNSPEPESY